MFVLKNEYLKLNIDKLESSVSAYMDKQNKKQEEPSETLRDVLF